MLFLPFKHLPFLYISCNDYSQCSYVDVVYVWMSVLKGTATLMFLEKDVNSKLISESVKLILSADFYYNSHTC